MALVLEPLLRCPACRGEVGRGGNSAALACRACGRRYDVRAGILQLFDDSLPGGAAKRAETAGWVEKARCEGWYEPDDQVDAVLPFVCRDLGLADGAQADGEHLPFADDAFDLTFCTVWAYLAAFVHAGLRIRRAQPGINELRYRAASALARVPKAEMTLAAVGELSVGPYAGVTIFARKPGG